VNRTTHALLCATVLLLVVMPVAAAAQLAPQGPQATSDLWLVGGGGFVTLRGDCQTCEDEYPYRHGSSVLANVGYRVNDRMDVGGEVFWMPIDAGGAQIRTTHFDAVAQFRPWATRGFFLKGGAGMALVRNWVDVTTSAGSINSKAFSLVIGGGWVFRPTERIGLQVFLSQHAAALGDFTTADSDVQDVIGNFWSFGAGIVFR
jgi:hypothetical protein